MIGKEQNVTDLAIRWQELRDQGQTVSAAELCADCPELREELENRIQAMQAVAQMMSPPASPGTVDGTATLSHAGPPTPAAPLPDQFSIPGYQVQQELGRGGMGVVCKAQDVRLKRTVAIKQLLLGGQASEEQRARFQTEAQAIAQLQHPHIVQVYQAGERPAEAGGPPIPFFVLEFVSGGRLDQKTAGRPEPVREAVRLVLLLARAVHAAHQAGVIHRDLKPANVLLAPPADEPALNTQWGCPKITDFGLARLLDSDGRLSATGNVMGTPSYMAPEQAEGRLNEIGPATDVWALGVILYELLAGQRPFQAGSAWGTIKQVCGEEPKPVRTLRPEVPEELDAVLRRCLHKKPGDRYPTAAALAEDLKRWLNGPGLSDLTSGAGDQGEKVATSPATASAVTIPAQNIAPNPGTEAIPLTPPTEPERRGISPWLVAAVGPLLVVVIGGWLLRTLFGGAGSTSKEQQQEVITKPVTPFKGWIDILVSEPRNPDRQLLRLHRPRARPLVPDDEVHIEVGLKDRPGYVYVLWIDAKGKVTPIYPWQDLEWNRRPAKEEPVLGILQLPQGGGVYPIEPSPPGLETLLLLVRDEPLPLEQSNLAERLGELGEQAWPDLKDVAWFENGQVVSDEPDRAPGKVKEPNNPAERLQVRVRERLGSLFQYSRAVVFGNQGRKN